MANKRSDAVKLTQEHYLRARDVDLNSTWTPASIFVTMQEIAEDNATAAGFGRVNMIDDKGYAWILTRMRLEMDKYPKIGDTVKVSTWPLKPAKLFFPRQFLFETLDGEVLGKASSQWMLFDVNKRQIKRSKELEGFPYDPELPELLKEPKKLFLPKYMPLMQIRKVLYSDVDMNLHMNNTKYLNWICELFSTQWLKQKYLASVKINYIAEIAVNSQVELYKKEADGGFYIYGACGGKIAFDSFTVWQDRDK